MKIFADTQKGHAQFDVAFNLMRERPGSRNTPVLHGRVARLGLTRSSSGAGSSALAYSDPYSAVRRVAPRNDTLQSLWISPISTISDESLQSKQVSQALFSAHPSSVQENAKTFPGVLDLYWRASSFPPDPAFRARLECFLASAEWPLQRES